MSHFGPRGIFHQPLEAPRGKPDSGHAQFPPMGSLSAREQSHARGPRPESRGTGSHRPQATVSTKPRVAPPSCRVAQPHSREWAPLLCSSCPLLLSVFPQPSPKAASWRGKGTMMCLNPTGSLGRPPPPGPLLRQGIRRARTPPALPREPVQPKHSSTVPRPRAARQLATPPWPPSPPCG